MIGVMIGPILLSLAAALVFTLICAYNGSGGDAMGAGIAGGCILLASLAAIPLQIYLLWVIYNRVGAIAPERQAIVTTLAAIPLLWTAWQTFAGLKRTIAK
jgi:hypothetical protein